MGQCLTKVLQRWQRMYPGRGWIDVVNALKAMKRNDIATEIMLQWIPLGMYIEHNVDNI